MMELKKGEVEEEWVEPVGGGGSQEEGTTLRRKGGPLWKTLTGDGLVWPL